MTHEAKTASNEEVDKIIDEVIAENQTLLKKLEAEENEEFRQESLVVGKDLVDFGSVIIKDITETTNADSYQKVSVNDYRTLPKKSKLELRTV